MTAVAFLSQVVSSLHWLSVSADNSGKGWLCLNDFSVLLFWSLLGRNLPPGPTNVSRGASAREGVSF